MDANPDIFDEWSFIPQRLERYNSLRPLSTLIRNRIDKQPNETVQDALAAVIEDLISGELKIEQYPELVPFFVELIRNTLVGNTISRSGGRLVKGGERSVKDTQFETVQHETAEALGLKQGLHEFQPESGLEWAFRDLFTSSFRPDPGTAEFYKAERDLWLKVYRAPVQTRRMAVAFGLVSFPPPVSITKTAEVRSDKNEDYPLFIKLGKTAIYDNH